MRILQVFVLLFFLTFLAKAQADGPIFLGIFLKDSKGQPIKNAKFETFDKEFKNKRFPFDKPIRWQEGYQAYSGVQLLGGAAFGIGFRISADGFETFERVLDLRFGWHAYSITLKAGNSDELSKVSKLTVIDGSISDLSGQRVPKVKITVLNKERELFNSVSNGSGHYWLFLPEGKYDLKFSADGFKTTLIKDFKVPSSENETTSKEKKLNLTLEVSALETLPRITNN